ncbi:MAG: hypothetical protein ABGX71_09780 [Methyloprofundus sp.]|uniref:hypothetical protein n=1 Tax=Methyloprofundus sp. TaxID=2020875 RepID=UPI002633FFE6|nr:hypothetical protein [Methyloprofundus sp.]
MSLSWNTINAIAQQYGDSFYLLTPSRFEANYQRFLAAFQSEYQNSRIAYSYKTNYTPLLCQLVQKMGGYAEVVSGMEYDLALRIGVPAERIIFNGPYKQLGDFKRALLSSSIVNLDSSYELTMLTTLAAEHLQQNFKVGIRCNFSIGAEHHSRFGFDVGTASFQTTLQTLRAMPNCRIAGIHCHFLAPERSAAAYASIAEQMIAIASSEFSQENLDFIDIGGGFFSPMRPELQVQFPFDVPSFEEYGHAIASVFARAYPEQNGPELILEPGISIAANTMQFAAKIIDLKPAGDRLIALAAASQYDIKPTLSPRNLPITVYPSVAKNMSTQRQTFDIVGSSCMESDCLYRGYQGELKPGDYVVFDNVGAYTNVLRPPFINPAPPILSYSSKHEIKVIRRRETTDDIFSSYSFTAFEQGVPTA